MKTAVECEVALRGLHRFPRPSVDEATEAWIEETLAQNYWRLLCEEAAPERLDAPAQFAAPANAA